MAKVEKKETNEQKRQKKRWKWNVIIWTERKHKYDENMESINWIAQWFIG